MASGATFHAKITADAREFIAQVEGAANSLNQLITASNKTTKAMANGSNRTQTNQAKAEINSLYDQAIAKGTEAHQKNMQQIKAENAERARERQLAQSAFRDTNRFRDTEQQALLRGTMAPGPYRMGDEGVRDIQALQELQRRGNRQIAAEQRKEVQAINKEKAKQAAHEREIANLNRQQLDAMVTGRYALYDMANAYQQIAMNAFRLAQSVGFAVTNTAKFETAFTAVERAAVLQEGTAAFDYMRESLIELSTQLPITFEQISEIATLGAQMGVAAKDIENFTRTIAAFSSITGTSIDETAEQFGRLSSLANVPVEEFENLASAVLFAGFNAVATEKEILRMSQSIAGAAANAGYTGKEIVGLATALASLGVQPEQARGVILRLFGEINRAIEGGGEKLELFAKAAQMSGESAQYLWRENPEQFFTALLTGLGSVENLTQALDQLGIVNTREINVIQRLTGSMDVYTDSLKDAAGAYEENTALADIYSKTSDNLETKIKQLENAFVALQAAAGEATAEAIKPLVDFLISLARAATDFARTDLGGAILPIVGAVSGLVAAFAGIRFVGAIATAQLLAMRTAILKMGQIGSGVTNVFTGLKNAVTGNIYVTDQLSGRTQFLSKQQIQAAMSAGVLDKAVGNQILSMNRASVATRLLSASMGVLGVAMAAITGIGVIAMVAEMNKMNNAVGKNVGGVKALAEAIAQDTEAFRAGRAPIATHTVEVQANTQAQKDNADASRFIIDAQGNIAQSFVATSEEIQNQTAAIGENFKQLMLQDIAESDAFKNLFDNLQNQGTDLNNLLNAMEINIADFVEAASKDPEAGAFNVLTEGLDKAVGKIDTLDSKTKILVQDLAKIAASNKNLQLNDLQAFFLGAAGGVGDLSRTLGLAEMGISNASAYIAQDLGRIADAAQKGVKGALEQYQILQALGVEFGGLTPALEDYTGATNDASASTEGLAKQLRTVLDFASDLNGVFSRVIELEFGKQISLDAITTGWRDLSKSADKARESIEDANREIKGLTADRSILEYQLAVAERYGDEVRAAKIRAELAKTNDKITESEKKKAQAEAETSRSLTGNTDAAIENRAAILGMVSDYQDYIETLAKLGRSPQQLAGDIDVLKRRFREQAIAAGFAGSEIDDYLALFDQFGQVATGVPRNVDIEVALGLDAAEQAINEFLGKNRTANVGVDLNTTSADKTWAERKAEIESKHPKLFLDVTPAELEAAKFINKKREPNIVADRINFAPADAKLNDWLSRGRQLSYSLKLDSEKSLRSSAAGALEIARKFPTNSTMYTSYIEMYRELLKAANQMRGYASGGLVTGPGGPKTDSIPAKLSNGEFVMQASAVKAYGADFMNSLNKQRVPMATVPSMVGAVSGGTTIAYLAPEDRALLRAVADRPVTLYADNTKIAQSANAGNQVLSQRGIR